MLELRISEDFAGVRLDKYLRKQLSSVPTSHLFKMIRTKKVKVNGKRCQPEQELQKDDLVSIWGDPKQLQGPVGERKPAPPPPVDLSRLEVLLEDEWILVINKPSGLAAHPGSGITGATVVELTRAYLGDHTRNDFAPSPAHRLDRETSGVLIVAKRRPAMVHFTDVFTNHKAKKRYLALVKGRLVEPSGVIDIPLAEHQQTADSKAKNGIKMQHAITRWKRLSQGVDAALVECTIETGRTHQIRRHFAAISHPVAGDRKHGDFPFNRETKARWKLNRMFLHAQRLEFPHPEDGHRVVVEAPLPQELVAVLRAAGVSF